MRRILVGILLALTLVLATALPIMAQSSSDIEVTATPAYLSFSSDPLLWTINGLGGGTESGMISENTTYYANPITDADDTTPPSAEVTEAECAFTWTNDSNINIKITVISGAFIGGGADMTNSGDGTNGPTTYGAYCWYSGLLYENKVLMKSSAPATLYTTVTPGEDKKWGCEIKTRTDAWSSGVSSTTTMTISAAASG